MRRFALLSALALAACAETPGSYPSLLPRPAESAAFAEPASPPGQAAEPVADPALDKQIAAQQQALAAAAGRFARAAQDAEARVAVARGVREGSDAWLDAQTGLSTLQSLAAPSLLALQQLESLSIARGEAGKPPYPQLDRAIQQARTLTADQAQRIHALETALAARE